MGGATSADRNVVSANTNVGIYVSASSNTIQGNYIGVGANGSTALGNGDAGIYLLGGVSNTKIGGTTTAAGNVIANNTGDGITLASGASSGNSFLQNSIVNNGARGIDFNNDGVTPNDVGDSDSGANGLQNYPVVSTAVTNTLSTTVTGTLNSNASTSYRIEFFSSAAGDSTGYGEGQAYLGSTNVTTNGSGNATYSAVLSTGTTVGYKVSAVATVDFGGGNYGSSSEFAQNATATLAPAGVTVSAISGNTSEAGGSATFTVVLDRAPTANVTIAVSSNNTIEGTVSTASLTFTSANWYTPQTVTVTGQDDTLVDGNRAYTVVLGAAASSDAAYNGLNAADVAVTNTDNDTQSTIVVTTNSDVVDGTVTSLYALLSNKGADGQISLREAITAANATANGSGGPDIINFAVGSGSFSIGLGSSLPALSQPTIVNGWSQTGYTSTPLVIIDCNQLGAIGIQINAAALASTVRGLVIRDCSSHAIQIDSGSNGNTIQGNYLGSFGAAGTDQGVGEQNVGAGIYVQGANNQIGGNSAATRNVIGGNQSQGVQFSGAGATGNLLQGNYIGLNAAGAAAVANGSNGVMVDGGAANNVIGTNLDGSNDATEGNVISGNTANGLQLWGAGSGNVLRGNLIGVNPAATAALPNGYQGVQIGGATTNTTVGGTTSAAANIISGNTMKALEIVSVGSTGNTVQGNYVGTNSGGVSNLPNAGGVAVISGAAANTIGGKTAGAGNLIAYNAGVGVTVSGGGTGNAIMGNSIFSNSTYGIDLADNGVTANDAVDVDAGDNSLQNFPVLTVARTNASNQLILTGSLNSTANTYFHIEFFASTAQDSTGYGEGQRYLGSINGQTDGSGNYTISTTVAANVAVGEYVTATATKSNAADTVFTDSSEFSRAIVAVSSTQATITVDTISDTSDGDTTSLSTLLANKGADGFISLREAITAANNSANGSSPDLINFSISGTGIHTITPLSALPAITQPVVIDATTEDSYAANGNKAAVELFGNSLNAHGLNLSAGSTGSTIKGLAISGFGQWGIVINAAAGSQTLQANMIGLRANGTTAAANTIGGIQVNSSSNLIGGTTSAQRNVISGNAGSGIGVGGSSNTITGNYIGTDHTGLLDKGNGSAGINVFSGSANAIGDGTAAGRNVISGNDDKGININGTGSGTLVKGNYVGVDSTGSGALGNSLGGIAVSSSAATQTIGGTVAGEGNTIANNTGATYAGVAVTGTATGVTILGNSIYSNGGLGIDIGATGATANDANDADTGANNLQNFPVLSAAVLNLAGTQITITGTFNALANTPYRIEFYANTTGDASGYGEGQRLIGSTTLTTDGSGNATINSLLTVVVAAGESITATATKSNVGFTAYTDTSEFSANVVATVPSWPISGTVYEDINYGGGAGRTQAASAGAAVNAARVELYDGAGAFVTSTNTAADGSYTFNSLTAGTYYVRVASQTVLSTRTGSGATLRGVLTWRADASSGAAVAVTNFVGGTNPSAVDPGNGGGGTSFNTATNVFTAGLAGTAHAVSPVVITSAAVTGVNFGFNFSTVVNTNDSGQGSLRQAITNANALDNTGLAQSGRTAGIENLVFMIGNGSAAAGLRNTINYFSGGVASIAPASALPTVSAPLVLDAQTQPGWALAPIVELNGTGAGAGTSGLRLDAAGTVLRGFVVNRFAAEGVTTTAGAGLVIQGNYIGTNAAGTAASPNALSGIWINQSAGGHQIGGTTAAQRNVVSGQTTFQGVAIAGGSGSVVQGNYIGSSADGTVALGNASDGIKLYGSVSNTTIGGTAAGAGNLIRSNGGRGILVVAGATGNAIQGNSIYGNSGLGIDLNSDGVNANDGAKTVGQANLLMDTPVFTTATLSGTTLTVAGYVGSAASQATFASTRVEVFVSDASSTHGQGQAYLGFVTTDASGNFSGTIAGVTTVTVGTTAITGTATDGSGNTSEFGVNVVVGAAITGTVFEDVNYGGGAGRTLAASAGVGVPGATVELYTSAGVWIARHHHRQRRQLQLQWPACCHLPRARGGRHRDVATQRKLWRDIGCDDLSHHSSQRSRGGGD